MTPKEKIQEKIDVFEYIIFKLVEWFKEVNPGLNPEVNFDKLKIFKLLFFVSAVNDKDETSDNGLLDIFDKFVAMPYGPVELDVYENLKLMKLFSLRRENITIEYKEIDRINLINRIQRFINSIDNAIVLLKSINKDLINLNAFDLVKISHKWLSWIIIYRNNKSNNVEIPYWMIKDDVKYFS